MTKSDLSLERKIKTYYYEENPKITKTLLLEGGTVSYSRIFAFRGESWNLTAAESKR
jgi:hypothetical protein